MKIVLDAGHGYHTPGKRVPDGSMREWEFNNRVSELVDEELKAYEDVKTLRVDDPTGKTDVSLTDRTNKANSWGADVYVSIHANAFGTGGFTSAGGLETFVYTTRPATSLSLAAYVQNHLVRETGRANRGVKAANFAVLRQTNMTAILVECGFMTNKEEAELLKTEAYRKKCAIAIVKGLVDQYKLKKKPVIKAQNSAISKATTHGTMFRVVTGSFSDKQNAEKRVAELKKSGFDSFIDIKE